MASQSLTEKAAALYKGEALAPMVRASTTPLRALALQYGADFVYTEELVDRAITETQRVENKTLNTVDYIKDITKLSAKVQRRMAKDGNRQPLLLRIDPEVEKRKLVCQIGTGEPELALPAVLHVKRDVDAFDINMGCPRKFSVSGGMGSALLEDPDRACRIVKTLRDNLKEHPVSCKIRLRKKTQQTLDLVTGLVNAGAHAIAIHARRPGHEPIKAADWDSLEEIIPLIKSKFPTLPLLINGDFYTRQEFMDFQAKHGTSGVLLGRPALYNCSIFRKPPADAVDANGTHGYSQYGYNSPHLLDKTTVVQDYLRQALRYNPHHKNVKYITSEMMSNRRTPTGRVPFMPQNYPGGQTIAKTCNCKSLEELCKVWDVKFSLYNSDDRQNAAAAALAPAEDVHRYSDAYNLQGDPSSFNANASSNDTVNNDTKDDIECPSTQLVVPKEPSTKRLKVT